MVCVSSLELADIVWKPHLKLIFLWVEFGLHVSASIVCRSLAVPSLWVLEVDGAGLAAWPLYLFENAV